MNNLIAIGGFVIYQSNCSVRATMCCKCCQYYLETIYWHCFEKHFCYDESIALYEDENTFHNKIETKIEEKSEKVANGNGNNNNNTYDNFAFYDNVAMIANRAIFCIEPLKDKMKEEEVVSEQPRKRTRSKSSSLDNLDDRQPFAIPVINEELVTTDSGSSISLPTITEETALTSTHSLNVDVPVKLRKKSLHERRVSKSLTLKIEKVDMPVIRQSSFPKFYLDTPEENQTDSSIMPSAIQALETPILPNAQFNFDLRSVVQIENEKSAGRSTAGSSGHKDNKISQIRDKLKPLKSLALRSASSNSLNS